MKNFFGGKNNLLSGVLLVLLGFTFFACLSQEGKEDKESSKSNEGTSVYKLSEEKKINVGAENTAAYVSVLKDKKVALVANQTSVLPTKNGFVHLLDTLLMLDVEVQKVFSPEHGFRGKADAGAHVADGKDVKTGLPIISLYGKNKKPSPEQLNGVEVIVFDIQDVGARFYTYLSTLHYVLEAASELQIKVLVLDRPNPNISCIDGPVLQKDYTSFVGLHPVPITYGMTIGEYAKMIVGEQWINEADKTDLTVVPCKNYTRQSAYGLPIAPSPNLKTKEAIAWYPTLCLFEGTEISCGRGTDNPFTLYGNPNCSISDTSFVPQPNEGSKYPRFEGQTCRGKRLVNVNPGDTLHIQEWLDAYECYTGEKPFFNNFFKKLAGNTLLQQQIEQGLSAKEIRESWQADLDAFKNVREKYLVY